MKAELSSNVPAGVALFDLDGTLLAWDCQLLFRHHVIRREPWRVVLLPVFLALLPLFPLLGHAGMKRVFLSFLWRMSPAVLAGHARTFAASVAPAIYPDLKAALDHHRQLGHLLILASASPEFYVTEIGRALGFHIALGTPVTTTPRCPFFPALQNHKGWNKVTRLQNLLPMSYFANGKLHHSHGYTDSRADLPMLGLCQSATLVNPSAAFTALADERGWNILRPARPWRTRTGRFLRTMALLTGLGKNPGAIHIDVSSNR